MANKAYLLNGAELGEPALADEEADLLDEDEDEEPDLLEEEELELELDEDEELDGVVSLILLVTPLEPASPLHKVMVL